MSATKTGAGSSAESAKAVYDALYAKVAEVGGDVRGEYGFGYAKTAYLSEAAKADFAAKKAAFDPDGVLNPGKILG